MIEHQDAVLRLLRRGPTTSSALQAATGVSQPTMARLLSKLRARGDVLSHGRGRATRYVARRKNGALERIPVARVRENGALVLFGELTAIHPDGFLFTDADGVAGDIFESIPWFLYDMRPQGFLGRSFPARFPELGLPRRIDDWSDDEILAALTMRGEDLIGDLIAGNESFERHRGSRPLTVDAAEVVTRYEELAAAALAGTMPGSSAGGEQPKFAVAVADGTERRHVLVKFSPAGLSDAEIRGRDLLRAESLALDALMTNPFEVAVPGHRLVEGERRVFLEVDRFDRTSAGRRGVVSLRAVDYQWVGAAGSRWTDIAARMERQKIITAADARKMRFIETFGDLIANTDMHFGNLSFYRPDPPGFPLALAPIYDQLPMLYAPLTGGTLVDRTFTGYRSAMRPAALDVHPAAAECALRFWASVACDARISAGFRAVAAANRTLIAHGEAP